MLRVQREVAAYWPNRRVEIQIGATDDEGPRQDKRPFARGQQPGLMPRPNGHRGPTKSGCALGQPSAHNAGIARSGAWEYATHCANSSPPRGRTDSVALRPKLRH